MAKTIDRIKGRIVGYDERRGELLIRAEYSDFPTMCRREYKDCEIVLKDSRPLSAKQRRNSYAMINEISEWSGHTPERIKDSMKFRFITDELQSQMDWFSLADAPMSLVAAFQNYLVRFILDFDIPTHKPLLDYVDDIDSYIFACLASKKCVICGKRADLHHVEAVGMGRDRDEIIHEGMLVLPLCREHHTAIHTMGRDTFFEKYHLHGVPADRTICKIYGLKTKKGVKTA